MGVLLPAWKSSFGERSHASFESVIKIYRRIQRDNFGAVKAYKQTLSYGGSSLKAKADGARAQKDGEAFGTGLLRSLADSLSLGDGESRLGYAV